MFRAGSRVPETRIAVTGLAVVTVVAALAALSGTALAAGAGSSQHVNTVAIYADLPTVSGQLCLSVDVDGMTTPTIPCVPLTVPDTAAISVTLQSDSTEHVVATAAANLCTAPYVGATIPFFVKADQATLTVSLTINGTPVPIPTTIPSTLPRGASGTLGGCIKPE